MGIMGGPPGNYEGGVEYFENFRPPSPKRVLDSAEKIPKLGKFLVPII